MLFQIHESLMGLIEYFLFGKDDMNMFVSFAAVDLPDNIQPK